MARNGKHYLLTIPQHLFVPWLPPSVAFIRGQLESGEETGYLHWQLYCCFKSKQSLRGVRETFGHEMHAELTRSKAARDYVFKEQTRITGTQFELGTLPVRRNESADWDVIKQSAKSGDFDAIPGDVFIRYYHGLRAIRSDYLPCPGIEKDVLVYYGATGTGKSRTAWEEHPNAFCKDPRTKFWCGYQNETTVIIDEFRGAIDVSHILRWCDRYPVRVEIKGSSVPLAANKIIFTSNLAPSKWYPELDPETSAALMRRFTRVVQFHAPL